MKKQECRKRTNRLIINEATLQFYLLLERFHLKNRKGEEHKCKIGRVYLAWSNCSTVYLNSRKKYTAHKRDVSYGAQVSRGEATLEGCRNVSWCVCIFDACMHKSVKHVADMNH